MQCIVGHTVHRNVIYLTISAQRRYMGAQLYWAKEMTADDDSDLQEKVKRTRNDKKVSIEQALNIYCFPFFHKILKKS